MPLQNVALLKKDGSSIHEEQDLKKDMERLFLSDISREDSYKIANELIEGFISSEDIPVEKLNEEERAIRDKYSIYYKRFDIKFEELVVKYLGKNAKKVIKAIDDAKYDIKYNNKMREVIGELVHRNRIDKDSAGMSIDDWLKVKTMEEIKLPHLLVDRLVGQPDMKKKAYLIGKVGKPRTILVYGIPGIGKTFMAKAVAELLDIYHPVKKIPYNSALAKELLCLDMQSFAKLAKLDNDTLAKLDKDKLHENYSKYIMPALQEKFEVCDQIMFYNPDNPDLPFGRILPAGWGPRYKDEMKAKKHSSIDFDEGMSNIFLYGGWGFLFSWEAIIWATGQGLFNVFIPFPIMATLYVGQKFFAQKENKKKSREIREYIPNTTVNNTGTSRFLEAKQNDKKNLFGDIIETVEEQGVSDTPQHERVLAGSIHRGSNMVVFIDEHDAGASYFKEIEPYIKILMEKNSSKIVSRKSEGKYVNVETCNELPANPILFLATNKPPNDAAFISRVRSSGYIIEANHSMPDNAQNRRDLAKSIPSWVYEQKDTKTNKLLGSKIDATMYMIDVFRSENPGTLPTMIREAGGIYKTASDIAESDGYKIIERKHMEKAIDEMISREYDQTKRHLDGLLGKKSIQTQGKITGTVNLMTVTNIDNFENEFKYQGILGRGYVTSVSTMLNGKNNAEKHAQDVSLDPLAKAYSIFSSMVNDDVVYDVDFIKNYDYVDVDSSNVGILLSMMSSYCNIPIDQSIAVAGAITMDGRIQPLTTGFRSRIEAAKKSGFKKVIVPEMNSDYKVKISGIEIVYAENFNKYMKETLNLNNIGDLKRRDDIR